MKPIGKKVQAFPPADTVTVKRKPPDAVQWVLERSHVAVNGLRQPTVRAKNAVTGEYAGHGDNGTTYAIRNERAETHRQVVRIMELAESEGMTIDRIRREFPEVYKIARDGGPFDDGMGTLARLCRRFSSWWEYDRKIKAIGGRDSKPIGGASDWLIAATTEALNSNNGLAQKDGDLKSYSEEYVRDAMNRKPRRK